MSPFLKAHFSADSVSNATIINAYESAERVILNAARFPKADIPYLGRLADELLPLYAVARLETI